jgi:hypothetical protein
MNIPGNSMHGKSDGSQSSGRRLAETGAQGAVPAGEECDPSAGEIAHFGRKF